MADDKRIRKEIANLLEQDNYPHDKAVKLSDWSPYDQNVSAGFFDAEWMFGVADGFDICIGNPPYIPIEQFSLDMRSVFKTNYPEVERKYDSSALFFVAGTKLLSANAVLSYIAPLTWQTGDNYKKLRLYLIKDKGVKKIINLPFDMFEGAYVDTGIYFITSQSQNCIEIFSYDKKAKIDSLHNIPFAKMQVNDLDKTSLKLSLAMSGTNNFSKLNQGGFIKLGEITKSTQGLSGSRFLRVDDADEENSYPFLEKGNVYNYSLVIENTSLVDLSDKLTLKQFYQAEPKVLIRRIVSRQDRLSVAYTEKRMVFKKDINPFIPTNKQFLPKYLLAVLASKFISYFYINSSVIATKDDFRQTTLAELRALPIPDVPLEKQAPIVVLVEQILAAKRQDVVGAKQASSASPAFGGDPGKGEADESLASPLQNQNLLTTDIPALEAEIDRLVYALYNLTDEEIALVEGKS